MYLHMYVCMCCCVNGRLRQSVYVWATSETRSSDATSSSIVSEADLNAEGGRRSVSLSLISNDVVIKEIRACEVSKSGVKVCPSFSYSSYALCYA